MFARHKNHCKGAVKGRCMRKHIKQNAWFAAISLCWLAMALSAQAASFDCAKARARIDKFICADVKLSKQDEEMAVLYEQILKASSGDPALKKAQRGWLKYRQICLAPDYKEKESACLSYLYDRHMDIMRGSLPTAPDADDATRQLCAHIAALVETKKAFDLEPNEYDDNPPRGNDFKNLDLDDDGVADSVKTGCGTGECLLEVELSSGGKFDLNETPFYLIRYQQRIYALVSYSEDNESKNEAIRYKYHLGRLYLIAPTGAKLVCGK